MDDELGLISAAGKWQSRPLPRLPEWTPSRVFFSVVLFAVSWFAGYWLAQLDPLEAACNLSATQAGRAQWGTAAINFLAGAALSIPFAAVAFLRRRIWLLAPALGLMFGGVIWAVDGLRDWHCLPV
jgi:hypothetical protein